MAIEFIHEGKHWKADTPGEAIRLRKALELDTLYQKQTSAEWEEFLARPWTPEVFNTFVTTIGEQQKAVVAYLTKHSPTSSKLAAHLGLESEMALAGVVSGLSKRLKRMGLKLDDLYTVNTSWNGKKKERVFSLQDSFRQVARELEWPKGEKGAEMSPPPVKTRTNSKTR